MKQCSFEKLRQDYAFRCYLGGSMSKGRNSWFKQLKNSKCLFEPMELSGKSYYWPKLLKTCRCQFAKPPLRTI